MERRFVKVFLLVACLFVSWAIAAGLNDVLIRQFRKALALTRAESSLVQFAFYIGYFCAALPAGMVIRRFGYKSAMLAGLALYAVGAFLFYPAATIRLYSVFLVALYTIAFGLAFLETSANPYVAILGEPSTASARLNLAQSFYGIGAIAGPIIGGAFIFSGIEHSPAELAAMHPAQLDAYRAAEASAVQLPYLCVGLAMCMLAALIAVTRFPVLERPLAARPDDRGGSPFRVLRHARLRAAVIAQFAYVGGQVGVWSFFIDFVKELTPAISEKHAAFLLSLSLALFMAGRFIGTALMQRIAATRLLAVFATINVALAVLAAVAPGLVAVAALTLTSFFMSIMFPTIFSLGVKDLGDRAMLGAPLIIMAIIGGAVFPPLMGLVSQWLGHIQPAMLFPASCFAIVMIYATRAHRGVRAAEGARPAMAPVV